MLSFSLPRRPPTSPLFPYTTLFRSGVGVGVASSAQGALGFEAVVEGDTLGLWFYEVVNSAVVPDSEIEVILTRVAERSEEHTSELQSRPHLVCRLLLEKKNATLTQN